MPTISELPVATSVSAADLVPISHGGAAMATAVGTLLASTQPAIIIQPSALLGRISLGSGGPEQVDLGAGVNLTQGTLVATGLDHAGFPLLSSLAPGADLVISNQGTPMLMPASLLHGLFSAGQNVAITADGTISATASAVATNSAIGSLPVVSTLAGQDLVAVSHAGTNCAINYSSFLDGVTIDQARTAGPAADTDTIWTAQGSNVMASQTFAAIWVWIANKLPTYKAPVVEVTSSVNLDTTVHNGRILVCSQPVTLTPLTTNMGSGFQCTVINASVGTVTLGSGFVTSTGSLTLGPQQAASIVCAAYSGGTVAFAAIAGAAAVAAPGQVTGLASSTITSSSIAISWQPPGSGGTSSSYAVQYRVTGTSSWSNAPAVVGATTCVLSSLTAATSYDIVVQAINAAGTGPSSSILTVTTAALPQLPVPAQVTGLAATPASSSSIQLSWSAQTGTGAATSFTVQYRVTGNTTWASSVAGISATTTTISGLLASTSYDFSVIGVNASGSGPVSSIVTAVTQAASTPVTSIAWNLLPTGPYTHGSGSIGVNALVTPGSAPIQFGFSLSATTPPASWTAAILVNTNLWGAYVPTPATAGTWYVWAEGTNGTGSTVSSTPFLVQ
nr:fibronectin type III domain-containing protein [uncultured Rhodopila sp.]